jgi:hypothetical protein
MRTPDLNLILAWTWISLGFVSGMLLGLGFHREGWLGGYGSFKRRLYRLAHISCFGLGALNLGFWLTLRALSPSGLSIEIASWAFVAGAISMPPCCLLMAHRPRSLPLFTFPVVSLLLGGVLTTVALLRALI